MSFYTKPQPPHNEYLAKYMGMATRFQNIGIAVVFTSIALHFLGGAALRPISLIIFCLGAIVLVYGGSSLRPHNLIKAFAQQCTREPNDTIADGLLEAIERNGKTSLTKNSIRTIHYAIETYASESDADPELVSRLRAAVEKHISKKIF